MSDYKNCEGGLLCETDSPFYDVGTLASALVSIQAQILGDVNRFHNKPKPCQRIIVDSVNIALSIVCAKDSNFVQGLYSKKIEGDSGNHTQEFSCNSFTSGQFYPFEKGGPVISSVQVVLLDADRNVVHTLTSSEFSASQSGIDILQDLNYPDAIYLRFSYDYDSAQSCEYDFLSEFKGPKSLFFKGSNQHGEKGKFDIHIYKASFSPITQLDLISQGNFFIINLNGVVEKDYTREDQDWLGGYFKTMRG